VNCKIQTGISKLSHVDLILVYGVKSFKI
jgi:hypothetical protein